MTGPVADDGTGGGRTTGPVADDGTGGGRTTGPVADDRNGWDLQKVQNLNVVVARK